MTEVHTHPKADELHVFYVPADQSLPMSLKVINNRWEDLGRLVKGYIEVIHPDMPLLSCNCVVSMVVNDQGLLENLRPNPRASLVYPHQLVVGDVVFIGEGMVTSKQEGVWENEMDFISLPPEFNAWRGPGSPYPKPFHPWHVDPKNKS